MKKKQKISTFSRHEHIKADCYRPERHASLKSILGNKLSQGMLPRGYGLSYGDSALNTTVIQSERLNRFIDIDEDKRQITLEPGVTFSDILSLKRQMMPMVIPGTIHASCGGAIANDVHGKNHYHVGAIGHHINWLELGLPNEVIIVSPNEHADLFYATIGGLGLTGFIKKINMNVINQQPLVNVSTVSFQCLDEGVDKLKKLSSNHQYSAGWIDFTTHQRGLIFSASHLTKCTEPTNKFKPVLNMPFTPPVSPINKYTLSSFNKLYYLNHRNNVVRTMRFENYNNPLDKVKNWNRLYGLKGFYQIQCVVPFELVNDFTRELLFLLEKFQTLPSLAVMKVLNQTGVGLLSFSKPGISFAFDFVNKEKNAALIKAIHDLLISVNGRVYLAKDSFLNKKQFQQMYPQFTTFQDVLSRYQLDGHFQSLLSRRLGVHS